jgi:hypothetical protein
VRTDAPEITVSKVPVEGGTGGAGVSPAAGTLREEMTVTGQRLLTARRADSDGRPQPTPGFSPKGGIIRPTWCLPDRWES